MREPATVEPDAAGLGRTILVFAVVVLIAAVVGIARYRHDAAKWEPDAAIYLRMTLQDRGRSPVAARDEADRFIVTTSEGREPSSRGFYGPSPPSYYQRQFGLFTTRPLFPYVAARLYGVLGPHALQAVSAASYVASVALMFILLLAVAPAWIAAIGSLGFALTPGVIDMATYGMTDEMSLLLWIAALSGIVLYVRRRSTPALALVVFASAALAFARPAAYLPFGAALGALVAVRSGTVNRRVALTLVAVTAAIAAVYAAYTVAVHGPGLREQLAWQYDFVRAVGRAPASRGFWPWYAGAELATAARFAGHEIAVNAGVFTIALAGFGLFARLPRGLKPVLLGGAAATVVALLANPLEFARTVELPLTPAITVFATAGLATLSAAVRWRIVS